MMRHLFINCKPLNDMFLCLSHPYNYKNVQQIASKRNTLIHFLHIFALSLFYILLFTSCEAAPQPATTPEPLADTTTVVSEPVIEEVTLVPLQAEDIQLTESLLFIKYTLEDEYKYQNKKRHFKWDKIKEHLAFIENMMEDERGWGVIQNYKNFNYEAPLVKKFSRNACHRVSDSLGTERYQSAPYYALTDSVKPEIYGRDGSVVYICDTTAHFYRIETPEKHQQWYVPKRYVQLLPDTVDFRKVVVVDRGDQHLTALEWQDRGKWYIRSKNPATTGRNRPPYAQPTPLGMFLIQNQKKQMVYLKDGSSQRDGFAPYASRFTNGAYIHGVPVKLPRTTLIEYSWSLGTTPRSHMCVRNATSHAKFIYEWAPLRNTLVIVIE